MLVFYYFISICSLKVLGVSRGKKWGPSRKLERVHGELLIRHAHGYSRKISIDSHVSPQLNNSFMTLNFRGTHFLRSTGKIKGAGISTPALHTLLMCDLGELSLLAATDGLSPVIILFGVSLSQIPPRPADKQG